ncbi:MAG: hypothetical protein LBQ97_05765 [Fusobacteriaceae bacterium]|jgi:hypothetical protein|nr:hypothetical protein [Fusobacteriaceae bacterium]
MKEKSSFGGKYPYSVIDQLDRDAIRENPEPFVDLLRFLVNLLDRLIPIIAIADSYSHETDLPKYRKMVTYIRALLDDLYQDDPEFEQIVSEHMLKSVMDFPADEPDCDS